MRRALVLVGLVALAAAGQTPPLPPIPPPGPSGGPHAPASKKPAHPAAPPTHAAPTHATATHRKTPTVAPKRAVVRHAPRPPAQPPHAVPQAAPAAPPAPPPPAQESAKGSVTGLPLPRYAALKSDEVNLRAGPGTRYPIEWIYKRRDLPVKIEREFDVWRLVEDMDGIKGWVHQATLTGRRDCVVTGTTEATLRSQQSDTADAVAILKPGVIGRIRACAAGADWCEVQVGEYRGFLPRARFFGTEPGEAVTP